MEHIFTERLSIDILEEGQRIKGFNLFLKDKSEQVGVVSVGESDDLTILIYGDFTHQGFATEATIAIKNYMLQRGLNPHLIIDRKNEFSIRAAISSGFEQTGKMLGELVFTPKRTHEDLLEKMQLGSTTPQELETYGYVIENILPIMSERVDPSCSVLSKIIKYTDCEDPHVVFDCQPLNRMGRFSGMHFKIEFPLSTGGKSVQDLKLKLHSFHELGHYVKSSWCELEDGSLVIKTGTSIQFLPSKPTSKAEKGEDIYDSKVLCGKGMCEAEQQMEALLNVLVSLGRMPIIDGINISPDPYNPLLSLFDKLSFNTQTFVQYFAKLPIDKCLGFIQDVTAVSPKTELARRFGYFMRPFDDMLRLAERTPELCVQGAELPRVITEKVENCNLALFEIVKETRDRHPEMKTDEEIFGKLLERYKNQGIVRSGSIIQDLRSEFAQQESKRIAFQQWQNQQLT